MKVRFLLIPFFIFTTIIGYTQCRPDSIFTYRTFATAHVLATIEYFEYNEDDTLILTRMAEFQNGNAQPVYETSRNDFKSGKFLCSEYTTSYWQSDRAIYVPSNVVTKSYSKKKKLLMSEKSEKIEGDKRTMESLLDYHYDPSGKLIYTELYYYSVEKMDWVIQNRTSYLYSQDKQSECFSKKLDTTTNSLVNDWKIIFSYDSTGEVTENVSYLFKNGAWVPDKRTVYGKETDKPIKWNIVQQWDGAKEDWINQFYYLFQLSDSGLTTTEVHLSWIKKEWVVSTTYHYIYDANGHLVEIQDDQNHVILKRYCN